MKLPSADAAPTRLRAFVAVEPGPEARQAVRTLQTHLQATTPADAVRWTRPEQCHLTLQFLGEVQAVHLPALIQSLEQAVSRQTGFRLELAAPGAFPTPAAPRVLWVGLGGALTALNDLAARVAGATAAFALHHEDRSFHPHLTLGRVSSRDPRLLQSLARLLATAPAPPPCPWTVATVTLYRSELRPAGPVYHELAALPLAAAP